MRSSELPYGREIREYVEAVKKALNPKLILLYGSVARGTFGLGSDVDVLVVAEDLPRNPNERLKLLYDLDRTRAPIDAKAYTPGEIRKMLLRGHPLILDALSDGKVLYADEDYLEELTAMFNAVRRKFRRFERGWIRIER
ncbi:MULTISPECIES: nucleotidyltransferase domain-containing protein [Thermococcus]|uniref:Nucleotidyltransferase n=1 Tax=Thermococcus barossii TaxID=54077 RepID=A0A2Z2MGZ2_9EURY|nr:MULTISPECIES: nucleotidyltransferase domain-containing protein [Thermococcus]ASJ04953.1 nucleotidyltransferase [Thermococcus barossii]NJE77029.1 nucleotidyltransferase domain-containing protein [Thermococcus sp. ES12]